jgi:glycosyltransferase involved in cell wall biosynthesis
MRIGQNPAKTLSSVAQPQEVTVAVLSYIPMLRGYYAQSLEVLKACLESIWENTRTPYDLMVFDNASCGEVRKYLLDAHQKGTIQFLVLSNKNYGKAGAWNFIFGAAPGKYIAYADSDVYHYPGWLEPQIEVLKKIPKTGMVTGMPMWTPEEYSTATLTWASNQPDVNLERGKFLPWEDYWKHSRSLGADEKKARPHYESTENIIVCYQGKRYYVGAAHFQFVAPKAVLQRLLPIPSNRPMGQVRLLDIALNEQGYLRFCTPDWWVRHMGNTLEDGSSETQKEIQGKMKLRSRKKFWRLKWPRRVVSWIYHRSFNILYRE